jgi:hypothetical protein
MMRISWDITHEYGENKNSTNKHGELQSKNWSKNKKLGQLQYMATEQDSENESQLMADI